MMITLSERQAINPRHTHYYQAPGTVTLVERGDAKKFVSMVLVFFALFLLSLFALLEFRPRFLEPLRETLWSPAAVSALLTMAALGIGSGVVLLIPGRTGEYEEYSLGVALLFLGSISLSIALSILLGIV